MTTHTWTKGKPLDSQTDCAGRPVPPPQTWGSLEQKARGRVDLEGRRVPLSLLILGPGQCGPRVDARRVTSELLATRFRTCQSAGPRPARPGGHGRPRSGDVGGCGVQRPRCERPDRTEPPRRVVACPGVFRSRGRREPRPVPAWPGPDSDGDRALEDPLATLTGPHGPRRQVRGLCGALVPLQPRGGPGGVDAPAERRRAERRVQLGDREDGIREVDRGRPRPDLRAQDPRLPRDPPRDAGDERPDPLREIIAAEGARTRTP